MNYCSVVSRKSVRIYFIIEALNEMIIVSGDTRYAYLNAKYLKKYHVTIKDMFIFSPSAVNKKKLL